MKPAATILLLALCGCASAMPPKHKTFQIYCTVPIDGGAVTACNFYKAHPADIAWTAEGSVVATNGQTVSVAFDATYELHTADSTNSLTAQSSDYCEVLTNPFPAVPHPPAIK